MWDYKQNERGQEERKMVRGGEGEAEDNLSSDSPYAYVKYE